MARRPAVRLLVVLLAALAAAASAHAGDPPPAVTPLAPADGARAVSFPQLDRHPTLRFRVDFAAPPATDQTVLVELAAEAGFAAPNGGGALTCAAGRSSCELTWVVRTGNRPGVRRWWRVRVGDAASAAWSFVPTRPPDRDRDSVPDELDNCPRRANRGQVDMEGDGKGDACQPDRQRPRVQAYAGSARRGAPAAFRFRVHDNRRVDVRATLRWHGQLALSGVLRGLAAPRWADRATWWTQKPIRNTWPAGEYEFCVIAVDRAGNRAQSCAPYRIR